MVRESEEKIKLLSKLKDSAEYTEIEGIYNAGIKPIKHEDISGSVKGRSTIYNHMRELLENAKKEIIICTSARDFSEKIRLFSGLIERLNKHGIKIRIALSGNEQEIKKLSIRTKQKIKQVAMNAKFFIIDQEQILFMLSDQAVAEEETAIWLNTSFFTNAMVYLFNQIWED
jgi:sugar-specific transcriptional regulator TrmB